MRAAFHSNADFAQLLDPAPDRRTRYADFAGDPRSADGNGGVVREQSNQGSEPLVRCARQGSGSHKIAVAYLSSMESTSKLRLTAGAECVSDPEDRKSAPVSA